MGKDILLSQKTNGRMENIFATHMTGGTLISYIEFLQIHSTKANSIEKKMGKAYKFQLIEEEIQKADKYIGRCSTL